MAKVSYSVAHWTQQLTTGKLTTGKLSTGKEGQTAQSEMKPRNVAHYSLLKASLSCNTDFRVALCRTTSGEFRSNPICASLVARHAATRRSLFV
jgi:hypothetical protein